ncbi:hypothetical protein FOA52_004751 [Chlamydomonas sp. UWO 241]|nr:hypothetical protein FOA52_004751 [Chlamydomonas sp. UWO 241]
MAMPHLHAQEEAVSAEAIQAVLLTSDLFGVLLQQLGALRNSPRPVPFRRDLGFDRSASAALRLVSRGMRELIDSVVPQLAVPVHKGTGISLESGLPRFAASLLDLTGYMEHLGDPSEVRDLASVELPCLDKLKLVGSTLISLAWKMPVLHPGTAARLREVRLSFGDLRDIEAIGCCQALRLLSLPRCNELRDLGCLRSCRQMQRLHLYECYELVNLGDLRKCSNLTAFSISECPQISSLAALSGCSQLTYLSMSDLNDVADLTPLQALPLRSLSLYGLDSTPDISPLSALSQLSELRLESHWALSCVGAPTQLLVIDIDDCKALADLNPLRACRLLEDVSMRRCTGVSSLAPLGGLPCLAKLRMAVQV